MINKLQMTDAASNLSIDDLNLVATIAGKESKKSEVRREKKAKNCLLLFF
jgi:hypothetical protein